MDDTYQIYVNRVARMTLPEAYKAQVQHIQPSPKFKQAPGGEIQPTPFPGYTVITPPWLEDSENTTFYEQLQTFQEQVLEHLTPGLLVPLPPDSFHLTLADLIWDSAYRHASENADFDLHLHDRIAESFHQCQVQVEENNPIYWQVMGLFVMTRAIGVCLAPKDESSYEQILLLRRAIYQNSALISLGIEQQYHFTAHITLGYFSDDTANSDRDQISDALIRLNQSWLELNSPQVLWVHKAELRKFEDMAHYHRELDWPTLKF